MQPNLPPPQQQPQPSQPQPAQAPQLPSLDYLDSIAAPPVQKTMNPFLLWGMIAGILIAVVIMVVALLGAGSSAKDNLVNYSQRVAALETISSDAQENIQSSDLRNINSNYVLILTGANQGVSPFITEKVQKKDPAVLQAAAEATELTEEFEEARLNALYDRVYAREMRFTIASLRAQMKVLYDKSNNDELKAYLASTDANFKKVSTELESFNAD